MHANFILGTLFCPRSHPDIPPRHSFLFDDGSFLCGPENSQGMKHSTFILPKIKMLTGRRKGFKVTSNGVAYICCVPGQAFPPVTDCYSISPGT